MCMLIHHPPKAERFTRKEFDDIYQKNKAGFGIMWRWPGSNTVSTEKGLWTPDRIWSTYDALYDEGIREMVLHWRLATSGAKDHANVHPFETSGNVLVAHNGVLRHRHTAEMSDTRCFIEDVLEAALAVEMHLTPRFVKWLERRIDSGNKMILWPRQEPHPTIVGRSRGLTYRGRWYSNTYAWSAPREAVWSDWPEPTTTKGYKLVKRWPRGYWQKNFA